MTFPALGNWWHFRMCLMQSDGFFANIQRCGENEVGSSYVSLDFNCRSTALFYQRKRNGLSIRWNIKSCFIRVLLSPFRLVGFFCDPCVWFDIHQRIHGWFEIPFCADQENQLILLIWGYFSAVQGVNFRSCSCSNRKLRRPIRCKQEWSICCLF